MLGGYLITLKCEVYLVVVLEYLAAEVEDWKGTNITLIINGVDVNEEVGLIHKAMTAPVDVSFDTIDKETLKRRGVLIIQRLKGIIEGLMIERDMEKAEKEGKGRKRKEKRREREGNAEKEKTEKENILERMMKMEATLEYLTKQPPQVTY
ncbi:hypothetical protein QVD17_19246 [Tagetes erecta]|uniref:Uncharacterized protein n=1 Tax=Tagetes erecta TaxID=13708 RepID=A0AAD8KJ57_TARER|nr:hypothetical protein QVD17_19246 [Tagetes erecta]